MDDIDTEKLKEILEMMSDSGAVLLQYKELLIQFKGVPETGDISTQVVGFEANSSDDTETEARVAPAARPTGYTALFGDKRPSFKSPKSSGRE